MQRTEINPGHAEYLVPGAETGHVGAQREVHAAPEAQTYLEQGAAVKPEVLAEAAAVDTHQIPLEKVLDHGIATQREQQSNGDKGFLQSILNSASGVESGDVDPATLNKMLYGENEEANS